MFWWFIFKFRPVELVVFHVSAAVCMISVLCLLNTKMKSSYFVLYAASNTSIL